MEPTNLNNPKPTMKKLLLSNKLIVTTIVSSVVIVALLTTGLVLALSNNKNSGTSNAVTTTSPVLATSTTETTTVVPTTDPYAGWKEYTSRDFGIKLKLPFEYAVNLEDKSENCDKMQYLKTNDCINKTEINVQNISIQYQDSSVYLDAIRTGTGGDCPENEYDRKTYGFAFLGSTYNANVCVDKASKLITQTGVGTVLDDSSSSSKFSKISLRVYSTNEASLKNILDKINLAQAY